MTSTVLSGAALLPSSVVTRDGLLRTSRCKFPHVVTAKHYSSCNFVQSLQFKGIQREVAVKVAAPEREIGSGEFVTQENDGDGGVYDCVVVGAGISGLVTAQALLKDHKDAVSRVLVTEARDRVGGNITTMEGDGYRWEEGPNSFQPNDAMLKAAVDAGCAPDLVMGDPKAPRYVYWAKKLRPTPSGPDILTFDLLTLLGKIRAGLGAIGLKEKAPGYEESVEQFVRRNLGDEVFQRLIEPFCSGVYAGDPAKLSMKAAFGKVWDLEEKGGSIIGGVIKMVQERRANPGPPRDPGLPPKPAGQTVGSFLKGLKTLPETIARSVPVRLQWTLKQIGKGEEGLLLLTYDTPEGERQITSRTVALTAPAYVVADLLEGGAPATAAALRKLDYPPVAAVTLSYPISSILPDRLVSGALPGFGQLHPRTQGIVTLGTIYSSSLFPLRAPDGFQELLCYIGGATNRGIVDQSEDAIVAQVDKDLRQMLIRPDAPPARKISVRVWPRAIPQFNVGHLDVVQAAKEGLKEAGLDNVFLGGNYVSGVALGKCVEYAYVYAKEIASNLSRQRSASLD